MRKYGYTALICAAAMMLASAGCQSSEINAVTTPETSETVAAALPAPAASTVNESETTVAAAEPATEVEETAVTYAPEVTSAAHEPGEPFETTIIDGESVVVMTTSSQSAETTVVTEETTVAKTTTDVTTTPKATEIPETTVLQKAIPDDGDIELELISGADVITTKVPSISVKVNYLADDDSFYIMSDRFTLEKLVDNKWTEIPFSDDYIWLESALEISKYSQPTIEVNLENDSYQVPITAGKYHVGINLVSPFSGDTAIYFAEFEIVDSSDEPEYEIVEENGHMRLIIDEIKSDGYVCENYFPLPASYFVECDPSKYDDFCVGDYIEVDYSVMYMIDNSTFRMVSTKIDFSDYYVDPGMVVAYKPVIYLYPQERTEVSVKLDYNGRLTVTDPDYGDGWTVTANPDGTLEYEGREYPYLFWEGVNNFDLDKSSGFCVSGKDTAAFLWEKLAYLGLNEKERLEFIEFWLPKMSKNEYNVITFAGCDYTDNAVLDITPSPDTVIRVFMSYTPSDSYVDIPEQQLEKAPERNGFTVVEWGGSGE